jgi:predicted nucleotidyltransferase
MPGRAVDSRGTADLAEDPSGQAEQLAARAGLPIPHILEAREHTRRELRRLRDDLAREQLPPGTSVCVFGSWARQELTPGSDNDWALLTREATPQEDREIARAVSLLEDRFDTDGRAPGSQKTFGCAFDVRKLIDEIGLEEDSNANITRRMLLLLESVAVTGEVRDEAWTGVLARYLGADLKEYRVPRFILNDLVRYWRTICVDFEGKHKDTKSEDRKWVTRNAKLRVSRKLLFAGGLLPILLCEPKNTDEIREFLPRWFEATPLDRLAAAFTWAEAEAEGTRALHSYDRWLAIMQSEAQREELLALRASTREDSPLYLEVKEIGETLERALLALLLDSRLSPVSRKYLIF